MMSAAGLGDTKCMLNGKYVKLEAFVSATLLLHVPLMEQRKPGLFLLTPPLLLLWYTCGYDNVVHNMYVWEEIPSRTSACTKYKYLHMPIVGQANACVVDCCVAGTSTAAVTEQRTISGSRGLFFSCPMPSSLLRVRALSVFFPATLCARARSLALHVLPCPRPLSVLTPPLHWACGWMNVYDN